ncbi:hypothetical protein V3C99_011899 [Haemonchus contortus]
MSKKKSRTQKKKFFAHPKNKNKIFKKKESRVGSEAGSRLRKRGTFTVLSTAGCRLVPHCPHGPCLLFGVREKDKVKSRYFACAVYRMDATACSFKAIADEHGNLIQEEPGQCKRKEEESYQSELKTIPKSSALVFCHECVDVFEMKHKCPAEIVTRAQLRHPSRLLEAKDSCKGEAQFFFSDESIEILQGVVERSGVDGVLCLGAPRLFEELRGKKGENRHLFLLDYDDRYARFFPATQFAQYSMLVDHFYDRKALERLCSFFAECAQVLLICDPPFGVFLEPLMQAVDCLRQRHKKARGEKPSDFRACIAIPMFVGKYVLRNYKDYWMSDYRVTYDNHNVFSKASKSTIRCFTNLRPDVFDLSNVDGYKFCEFCEKYVSTANKHCFLCSACTSKDGSPYKHCELCMRCVKKSYRHCKKCERCHLEGRCFDHEEIDEAEG